MNISKRLVAFSLISLATNMFAMEEEQQYKRKRRVTPCCKVGTAAKTIFAGLVGFLALTQGVAAQESNQVAVPTNSASNSVAELEKNGFDCFQVQGKFCGWRAWELRDCLCEKENPEYLRGYFDKFFHGCVENVQVNKVHKAFEKDPQGNLVAKCIRYPNLISYDDISH